SRLGVTQIIGYSHPNSIPNRSSVTSLSFTFDKDVSANLTPDDLVLRDITDNSLISSADLAVDWDSTTLTATWYFQGMPLGELPAGQWQATIKTSTLGGGVAP